MSSPDPAPPPPRGCPVCGSADRDVLFRQQFVAVAEAPVTGYDVAVCRRCGCGYADGIADQAAFDRYYREMSKYEYGQRDGAESIYDASRLEDAADIFTRHFASPDLRILDVGCASGRLLADVRDRGFTRVSGLDPSPACAAAAKRLYGIDVRSMTLGALAGTDERFDVIIMIGVLEHLRELHAALGQVRTLLVDGGLLCIEVPDATAFADWPNAPYQDFSIEHINFFSPRSLGNLTAQHGFSQVFLEQNHRDQSFRTVMSNISAVFRKGNLTAGDALPCDTRTREGLERYLECSAAEDRRLRQAIDAVVDGGRPIVVWGVGTHTRRLMATSRLADADIVAFVESNARYHGKTFEGRPILEPAALAERAEPVLISSRVFQREIADQVRDLGCDNELILLYDV